jgi:hypothetical protein
MEKITMKKLNTSEDTGVKMSGAVTPPVDAVNQFSSTRSVGVIALAYSASMIVQNAVFAVTGAPDYSDPLSAVLTYHAENQSALAVAFGLEAFNMVLLLLFVTALHGLVKRRGGLGENWSRLAIAAGATLSALFALTIATHITVVLAANGLTESNIAFEMMWRFHAACFALAMPALGLTFIGTVLATHANGLTRPWQRLLGVVGGILPILAGIGNLAIAGGSSILYPGVIGLFLWLFWLIVTGLRLIHMPLNRY